MKVQVFAALKDHFEKEFEVASDIATANELVEYLVQAKPLSATILYNSRFAVNEEFVDLNFKLDANDIITIIPPSSGG